MGIESSLLAEMSRIALAMFRKNFLGIFHGSLSARVELNKFVINRRDAIFDALSEEDFILLYHTKDYRWKDASMDSEIHSLIYTTTLASRCTIREIPTTGMNGRMWRSAVIWKRTMQILW